MKIDKPIKPTKGDRDERKKLGFGKRRDWKHSELPDFDPDRLIKQAAGCTFCGYPARAGQPIYVCTKCGNCQACGSLNQLGVIGQGCTVCGNGLAAVADPASIESVTTMAVANGSDENHGERQDGQHHAPVDHAPQLGLNVTNVNPHP